MTVFVNRQEELQELDLRVNHFGSEASEQLLTQLVQSKAIKTIQKIDLYQTADFSSDAAVQALANIVATAPALSHCDISGQQGTRRVQVEVEYATAQPGEAITEDKMGLVTVKDKETGAVIYSVATMKKSWLSKVEIVHEQW